MHPSSQPHAWFFEFFDFPGSPGNFSRILRRLTAVAEELTNVSICIGMYVSEVTVLSVILCMLTISALCGSYRSCQLSPSAKSAHWTSGGSEAIGVESIAKKVRLCMFFYFCKTPSASCFVANVRNVCRINEEVLISKRQQKISIQNLNVIISFIFGYW